MNVKTTGALSCALTLIAAAAAAGDSRTEPRTETRTTEVTRQVMVMSADGAPAGVPDGAHQIVVMSRAEDGAQPSVQVKVLDGDETETIDLEGLEVGETKSFETESGKEIVVSRTEAGLNLSVDGKDIDLPSIMSLKAGGLGLPGCAALAGSTIALAGDKTITLNGTAMPHVIVAPQMHGNFENLKSLEGLDPDVREKVVAALHEILSGQAGAMAWTMQTSAAGEPGAPAHEVQVRRIVVEDDEHVQ